MPAPVRKTGHHVQPVFEGHRCEGFGQATKVTVEPAAGGTARSFDADVVLVSIGRVPFTEGLGLEDVGVKTDNKGRVIVDVGFASNVPGIYAIGDVIADPCSHTRRRMKALQLPNSWPGATGM